MPYIKQERRRDFEESIVDLTQAFGTDVEPGDLNYVITRLVGAYVDIRGEKYATYASVTGVVENVKSELYRRLIGPFEDRKLQQNGDAF